MFLIRFRNPISNVSIRDLCKNRFCTILFLHFLLSSNFFSFYFFSHYSQFVSYTRIISLPSTSSFPSFSYFRFFYLVLFWESHSKMRLFIGCTKNNCVQFLALFLHFYFFFLLFSFHLPFSRYTTNLSYESHLKCVYWWPALVLVPFLHFLLFLLTLYFFSFISFQSRS